MSLKKFFFIFIQTMICGTITAQPHIAAYSISIVDSIAKSGSTASVFSRLYIKTMDEIEKQLAPMDSLSVNQIRELEKNFCTYFINACKSFNEKNDTVSNWYAYFRNAGSSELKLKLFGINAHINGDLWQALRDSYNKDEIKNTANTVFLFHRSLLKIYDDLYDEARDGNKKIKMLHVLSLGFTKSYGRHLLKKWRKRQIRIATLYYYAPVKFERLIIKTERKKNKIDKTINRHLKN